MYGYIYITTNLINGKKYIGQHKSKVFDTFYLGSGKILKQAIKLYGRENFKCELLEWCKTLSILNKKEIYYIKKYHADESPEFYNICTGGNQSRGRKGQNNPRYGIHLSEETKRKIGNANKGRKRSREEIEKWQKKSKGKTRCSDKHYERLSNKFSGSGNPMYGKPSWNKGIPMKEETKEKISISKKGKYKGGDIPSSRGFIVSI